MSRKLDEVKLEDGTRIKITELTAPQCDVVFTKMEEGYQPTALDKLMVGKHIPEFALDMITEPIKLSDLVTKKKLAPSEFEAVYDKAQTVNDFLFQALQSYREKGGKLQELESIVNGMTVGLGEQASS